MFVVSAVWRGGENFLGRWNNPAVYRFFGGVAWQELGLGWVSYFSSALPSTSRLGRADGCNLSGLLFVLII